MTRLAHAAGDSVRLYVRVCVLGLPNLGDATAAAFTGFGAGESDELGDEEVD